MRKYQTANLQPSTRLSPNEASWIYNGLDCCVTFEVYEVLMADLAASPANVIETYRRSLRKIPPILYMNMKGLRVDRPQLERSKAEYQADLDRLKARWDLLCTEVLGYTVNWNSPVQMNALFYTTFGLKPKKKRNANGGFSPTTNADALESFRQYYYMQPFVNLVLEMREINKRLSFLKTELDEDGRIRTQLNIAGTVTGRLNSKFSASGSGSNLQNVENRLRQNFIPEDGNIFVNVDLEQGDSRGLGATLWQVFLETKGPEKAGAYLDACESGDLHTKVCQMCWGTLGWPKDGEQKAARAIAEQIFYRHYSYRDMSKRLGHGTNFFGMPFTMALHTKTEQKIVQMFQERYFAAFPLIGNVAHDLTKDDWHGWVYRQLNEVGYLNNLFGRRRHFFGRATDSKTLRDAIAYGPQSTTGEFLDIGWMQLWDAMPSTIFDIPVHDSILFQLPIEGIEETLPQALKHLRVEIELKGGRTFSIPLEAKVGWNWADTRTDKKTGTLINPLGLQKWKGVLDREPPRRERALKEMKAALRELHKRV